MIPPAATEDHITCLRYGDRLGDVIPGIGKRTVARGVISLRGDIIGSMRSGINRPGEIRIGLTGYNRSSASLTLVLEEWDFSEVEESKRPEPSQAVRYPLILQESRDGYVKLLRNDESGKIVGGQIIGPDASTLIDTLALVVTNRLDETAITGTIFPHPTTGEVIHEAALGLSIGSFHA